MDFEEAVGWTADGKRWKGEVSPAWLQGRTLFGGLAAAIAVRALRKVSEERPLRTVSSWFVAPLGPGPATMETALLRRGGSVSHAQARIYRDDAVCTQVSAVFGSPRTSTLHRRLGPAEPIASVEDALAVPFIEGVTPAFTRSVDLRWTGALPFSGAREGVVEGWCRHRTPAQPGPAALLALLDAWPPPALPMMRQPGFASTVTWTAHLTGDSYADPAGWWYYRGRVEQVRDGYANTRADLWSPDGEHAAWSEQLAVVFA